ncbi:hypothetical protein NC652_026574 [Populus alba x Populus x berolinensis]|nr:hypothetical protein NC652_026574 [Populus alba x Populus x berolinensis]
MPVTGNEEAGVKPLAWQSSLNIAGVPIKKRRFIWPPSPPRGEQSVPLVENDSVQKEPGRTFVESTLSNASVAASSDLCNPCENSVLEENKNRLDGIVLMNIANCSVVKVEELNQTIQSDSLAEFGKEEKLVVAEKYGQATLISAKNELNIEDSKGKEIHSQQISDGKCKSEAPLVSETSQFSLGLKEHDVLSFECYSNVGSQNHENAGAVSSNLSLTKGETGIQHKMYNILATDSTDLRTNRSNWDLNTTADTWDGSTSDEHAAQVTADAWNRVGVIHDITTGIIGTGIAKERQLLDGSECRLSFPQTFSECAKECTSEDSLHLRLSPSFPSFNLSKESSSSSANKESQVIPNISLPGVLLSAGNATMVNSRTIKSEPFDESLKHDLGGAKVNPFDFFVKRELVEKGSPETAKSSAFVSLKLAGQGFIKPEPFPDGKPEIPRMIEGVSIQPDKHVLQGHDTGGQAPCSTGKQVLQGQDTGGHAPCSTSKQELQGQDTGGQAPSCSTNDWAREGQDILAKPTCSTGLSISGNASECLEHTKCAEGVLLRKEIVKEACESAGQVSSEMVYIPVGHSGNELNASVKIDTAITEGRNVDISEQCELNFTEEVPAGSHGNDEGSVTDEEKINLSGDMLEEDTYGSGYESDGHSMAMDIEEEHREHEYEDGEVQDPRLQAVTECQKFEGKDVSHGNCGNSEHEKVNSELAVADHHISSHVEENDSKIKVSENNEDTVKECITTTTEDADNAIMKNSSTVEIPSCGEDQERATTIIQRKSLDTSGQKDDLMGPGADLSPVQDITGGQGTLVSIEQGSDKNTKTNDVEKNELPEVEASLNGRDMAKDVSSGRSRIINLSRASNSSSPGKTRSISGRTLPSHRERLPDVLLESGKLHPRGRDENYFDGPRRFPRERHQEHFPRNSRMNFVHGRGRMSSRIDTLRGDRDSERNYASEIYTGSSDFAVRRRKYASAVAEADSSVNYNIGPDGAFVGTARGGRKLLDDETPLFRHVPSRRRSPRGRYGPAARGTQMLHRVPRNIGEDGSEVAGVRHAENTRGFPDDGTDQAFTRPQPSYEGLDGHFVQGTRNYSSVQRTPPQVRSKSPIRSRSPCLWSSARRRSPDGFGAASEFSSRRSPIYRIGRVRSPDHPGFPREMAVRRNGSPPFLSRPNDTREMDLGRDHGHPRSIISNRGQTGRVLLRNGRRFGITDLRERRDGDEFFGGPMHSGRFQELGGDGNVEDRRRFSERRGPVRTFKPFNGADGENFRLNAVDGPRPLRFFPEDDPEFHERANLREREFDGQIKNCPGNAPRRPRGIEERAGNYRHGGHVLGDDGFDDISPMKRKSLIDKCQMPPSFNTDTFSHQMTVLSRMQQGVVGTWSDSEAIEEALIKSYELLEAEISGGLRYEIDPKFPALHPRTRTPWVMKMMMMNQGVNAQTIASVDPNSLEGRYVVDANQGKTSYIPSVNGSETAPWTTHRVDNHSTENGILSNSSYHHDQQTQQPARNAQDSLNTTSLSSSSTQETTNVVQDYSSYAAYNPTDPYGYGSTGYATSYYNNGYQQQTNHSYSQQQPNHSYSQQQQPSHSYSQQQQPSHSYSQQQQPSHSYSQQQQPSHSYSSTVGAYQNTGAPYQPLSSFQNTGSYSGTTSYSTTYYNPGDYQTAGGYPSSGYNNQTTLWNDSNYANYTSQQYSTYAPDTTSAYSSGTAASTSMNNEQHYKQWADYYSQTEVICAPGTEHLSAASTSNQGSAVSGVYPTSSTQPPSSFTPTSQRTESASSDLPSLQTSATISSAHDGWKQGAPSFQIHHASPTQPHFQYSLDSKASYDNFQEQQQTAHQGPNSQFPAAHQVTQSYQSPLPNAPSLDTRNMMQIPTNPRIASNLALGLSKTDKDGSMTNAAAKPAYISVSMPNPNNKVLSNDTTISMLKIITKATANGTLNTLDWDAEPLFAIPNSEAVNVESSQYSTPFSSVPKYKRSPSRRSKSRWEPLPEEKSVDKSVSTSNDIVKYGGWDRKAPSANSESKENAVNNVKFSLSEQKLPRKNNQRPVKRQHLADEEKKKRESRSKRFEKGQGYRTEVNYFKPKNAGAGNFYSRRASASMLSNSFDDSGSKAVEDIDWDALTVKGTCQEIEKRFLRLTSAPDPSTVRPEEVLEKALLMVQNSQKNYLYKCDQLKSIRQDLTVQRIQNQLTVKVYETHARLALEAGDLPEYNQCQSQLKTLYAEGIEGCHMEFAAYNLLCVILHSNNNRDLVSSMSRLVTFTQLEFGYADARCWTFAELEFDYTDALHIELSLCCILWVFNVLTEGTKKDKAVKHALAVRAAVTSGNYVMFFRLYKEAPNLNTCLMDLYVEKMRYKAVSCMSWSYRPTIPVSYISQVLGFSSSSDGNDEKDSDGSGLEECVEWMKAHGACLTTDNNGEMQLDAKASSSSLYMPEPEDAVAHGDANLAVNDFLTRTSL